MSANVTRRLRLGVLGLSEGNGHPYSWSAIFNGYDPLAMNECGFPVIPAYLARQRFPEDAIAEAQVTQVWAQDRRIAEHIAQAALIPNVVERAADMIGHVDAVLLARDDAENHLEMAAPFLDAALPVYVDKPLALSVAEARQLYARQRYPGQLFSCSALRYAREFTLTAAERAQLGPLRHIHAMAPKDWDRYAVHVVEPLLLLADATVESMHCLRRAGATTLSLVFSNGLQASVSTLGAVAAPLSLRVIGERGWKDMVFGDSFFAFKRALYEFVQGVLQRDTRIDPEFTMQVVGIIEAGRQ
jgi:predicted dehydrogenase